MQAAHINFLPVNLKTRGLQIGVCHIDGCILVNMRDACKALRYAWRAVEQQLMTAGGFWQIVPVGSGDGETLLMPATKMLDWLEQPNELPVAREGAIKRQALADIWAFEFPRQVLHLFPDSSDARSHAAKLARAIRAGTAVTDPFVAAGIKKAFLTIRQNRKPIDRPPEVKAERAKTIKRCQDVTPDLAIEVCRHFQKTNTFRGLADHFKLTTPALNRIIAGRFKSSTPELLTIHRQTFPANSSF